MRRQEVKIIVYAPQTAAVLLVIVFLLNLLAGLVSKTLKKGEQ